MLDHRVAKEKVQEGKDQENVQESRSVNKDDAVMGRSNLMHEHTYVMPSLMYPFTARHSDTHSGLTWYIAAIAL